MSREVEPSTRAVQRREPQTLIAIASCAAALAAVLTLHLTLALIAGMLVYALGRRLAVLLEGRTHLLHPAAWSIGILAALTGVAGVVVVERAAEAAAAGLGYQALLNQMAAVLDQLRTTMPGWLASHVPASLDALRMSMGTWLRGHANEVALWGQHTLRGVTYVLAGAIIGGLAVIQGGTRVSDEVQATPWLRALAGRFALFERSFSAVVFAQLRIAAINTLLTGIYVLAVLPAIGAPLPLALTLVAFTFVVSLVPIVGNLISSTVIVVVSLSQGLWIASLSLAFLVVIHKLEYFLNAHIVGSRIHTKAFELLAVMLLFEAMFGVAGLVMAPIVYAYAKAELRAAGWL